MGEASERVVALQFHPEGYSATGPRLMGRQVAGASFLRGLFAHSRASAFQVLVDDQAHGALFQDALRAAGRVEPVEVIRRGSMARLGAADAMFLPGPDLANHGHRRSLFGDNRWSLSAITHTTASAQAMDAIVGVLCGPVQPWDALICTSEAVKANVLRILEAERERLAARLGACDPPQPQLPVIPLGIEVDRFVPAPGAREAVRGDLGLGPSDVVVLFVGRLSFHAKAHPLAMYQAVERAAAAISPPGRPVILECGWFANAELEESFAQAAAFACPSVRRITLDGREPVRRAQAFAAADVFCSLSDNIQETFGLTPVEAMAAGLPAVVSDWDGYRDTVRHAVDGFRIPTLMPEPGAGTDLALRHALEIDSYDRYCGYTCAFVAVDVEATANAFRRLFTSADLRRSMGAAGRRRAREVFDWSVIIPAYEALWSELAARRRSAGDRPAAAAPWPARMDPFDAFSAYPSRRLQGKSVVGLAFPDAAARLGPMMALTRVGDARPILPKEAILQDVLARLADGPEMAENLFANAPPDVRPRLMRAVAFLTKLGLLRVLGA